MAGFILVCFFGVMIYLLSRISQLLIQIHEVLTICFDFDDLTEIDEIPEYRVSNTEEGGFA